MNTEEDDGVFQVVMLNVIREPFEKWLSDHHLHLYLMPTSDEDLPTYGIGIEVTL